MALVRISDFNGSEVANTVYDVLEMIGIVNKLNTSGYHISIDGIQDKTPDGFIDDTPRKHEITIERNKFVCSMNKSTFRSLPSKDRDAIINEMATMGIKFTSKYKFDETREISRDNNSYVWYKHSIKFRSDMEIIETSESYVKRMFESIADLVILSFEEM